MGEMAKRYRIFIPEKGLEKVKEMEGVASREVVIDEDTQEQFHAKIMISAEPSEGYDDLVIQERGGYIEGKWYIKILEREEEDEEITVFESMKLGERRGYMLRSMMAEESEKAKKETMTSELEKRWKQKQQLVSKLLKKEGEKKEER
jgi:hypothetical protein